MLPKTKTVWMAVVLTGALGAGLPGAASADDVVPPDVPAELRVPPGNRAFLEGHAYGTQNYVCAPSGLGLAWRLFTPQATLLDDDGEQLTTHYFGPNPAEDGTIRAAWEHSRDTSVVFGQVVTSSTDAAFVAPGAVAWLLLRRVGTLVGPTGGDVLTRTSYIQRVHTSGGVAPADGCASVADVGRSAFVPYTADYVFYRAAGRDD